MKSILNNVELTKLSVLKEELELLNEEIEELEIRLNHFENEDEDGSEMEEISFLEAAISKAEVAKDNLESEINSIIKPIEEVYESKYKLEERIVSYLLIQILKTEVRIKMYKDDGLPIESSLSIKLKIEEEKLETLNRIEKSIKELIRQSYL
jgi:predicted  nucleic acid-binding Zn-ribbon protein